MKTVLLLNSDKRAPIETLGRRRDIKTIVICAEQYVHEYAEGVACHAVPSIQDISAVGKVAREVFRTHRIDRIIGATDKSMAAAGWLRTYFGYPGIGAEQALWFSNKIAMKERLRIAGVETARFRHLPSLAHLPGMADDLGWPVIVKPAVGSGCTNVMKVESVAHLEQMKAAGKLSHFVDANAPFIAEECLDLRNEYHCDAVIRNRQIAFASVTRYMRPMLHARGGAVGGFYLDAREPAAQRVAKLSGDVVAAFGLVDGVIHLEALEEEGRIVVGEVACRPGGGAIPASISRKYGVELWEEFMACELGEQPSQPRENGIGHVCGYYQLPAKSGKVTSICEVHELMSVPGVDWAAILCRSGDVMSVKPTSATSYGAFVTFRISSRDGLPGLMQELDQKYKLEVVPNEK